MMMTITMLMAIKMILMMTALELTVKLMFFYFIIFNKMSYIFKNRCFWYNHCRDNKCVVKLETTNCNR